MMRCVNVLFDLDGTLSDPREGITRCIQVALEKMKAPVPSQVALETFIGPPLRQAFAALLGTNDVGTIERALAFYRVRYRSDGMFENRVYDGVPEMLDRLRVAGHSLFVATSKPREFAEKILAHFALAPRFLAIHGAELDGTRDDKADLIRHLLAVESLAAAETVMIGDRKHDVVGARASACRRTIGVTWGFGSEAELRDAGAHAICHAPHEIPDAVQHAFTSS